MENALKVLKQYFGYSTFRKGQDKIISCILEGHDVFAIMPTGGGKSICYQVPALLLPGVTVVISPLISLMKDQVDTLEELGISSCFINSSLGQKEIQDRLYSAARGKYKIVYVAPERLESERFRAMLKGLPVSLLAIDESHCVSQWGHDFRPSYCSIGSLIEELEKRPVVAAFTATATEQVKNDVIQLLTLKSPKVFVTGFNRENLSFSVIRGVSKTEFITGYLDHHLKDSGIIYAATRKEVDKLQEYLRRNGYSAGKYHAGMNDEDRIRNQEAFIYDNVQVIVATNAFGMGIDKSNVRFVIHLNMPKSMEAYYQEAGRAGRDGEPAECILLFGASDVHIQKYLIEQTLLSSELKNNEYQKLQQMVDYCHTSSCLRRYILEYFDEEDVSDTCNNCSNCNDNSELADITIEAQKIFSCIKRMREQYGATLVANVLKGSNIKKIHQLGFTKLPTYGIMKEYTLEELTRFIHLFLAEDYLIVTGGQYPTLKLTQKAVPVLLGKEKVLQKIPKKTGVVKEDTSLFDILRSIRKRISEQENVAPYVIFHDSALKEMCKYFPVDKTSMLSISGVGENKFRKYGIQFIEAIQDYAVANGISTVPKKPEMASPIPQIPKIPSHRMTYELLREGKSLEEISIERKLTLVSVQEHMVRCAQEGLPVNWDEFIPGQYEQRILEVVKQLGAGRLKPLKEALPEEIDYFSIKAVICKHFRCS